MNNCYRVEVNQKSKYFKEKKKACDYFMKTYSIERMFRKFILVKIN